MPPPSFSPDYTPHFRNVYFLVKYFAARSWRVIKLVLAMVYGENSMSQSRIELGCRLYFACRFAPAPRPRNGKQVHLKTRRSARHADRGASSTVRLTPTFSRNVAVVRHHQQRPGVLPQRLLQVGQAGQVEVVGRLVEQRAVAAARRRSARRPGPPAAARRRSASPPAGGRRRCGTGSGPASAGRSVSDRPGLQRGSSPARSGRVEQRRPCWSRQLDPLDARRAPRPPSAAARRG